MSLQEFYRGKTFSLYIYRRSNRRWVQMLQKSDSLVHYLEDDVGHHDAAEDAHHGGYHLNTSLISLTSPLQKLSDYFVPLQIKITHKTQHITHFQEKMGDKITTMEQGMQRRTELLLGKDNLEKLQAARVLIFGIGGVGSWCAEGLVRSGVRHITIVDSDRVCVTNCNRQLMATSRTIGQVKVDALRERLLEINPNANITAYQKIYEAKTADEFHMEEYDYIIDAIDSLKDKADLILRATALPRNITFVSSMGAALRCDPFMIRKAEFWKIEGDPLARALRKKFKKDKTFPRRKFQCVYSEEKPMQNLGVNKACGTGGCLCPKAKLLSGERGTETAVYDAPGDQQLVEHEWCSTKAQINGSLCHITASFGMAIAGIVIGKIMNTPN